MGNSLSYRILCRFLEAKYCISANNNVLVTTKKVYILCQFQNYSRGIYGEFPIYQSYEEVKKRVRSLFLKDECEFSY